MRAFKDISFGYSSAETERSHDPSLLLNGYIDFKAASEQALTGPEYLFLGYKGAGKSTIGERIKLVEGGSYSKFVKLLALSDFPFTPFSKMVRGDLEPESKYPTAWSWILLVYILESLTSDESLTHPDMQSVQDAVKAFREMGLSPAASPASIVRASAKNNFKISLPGKLAEWEWSKSGIRAASEIPDFVESLKNLLIGAKSLNKHILILDGLDDVLTSREVQFKSLSALVFEVSRLNKAFFEHNVPVKIILLCRTDVFERIPGANKNKIRQDYSVELDWYHDPQDPEHSSLVRLAQLRTSRSLGSSTKLFEEFFPKEIKSVPIARSLLDMTRHTPRDFLRLLVHIQEFSGPGRLTEGQITSGLKEYSKKYFMPEIVDELSGYATPEEITSIFRAIGKIRKRDFKLSELIMAASSLVTPLESKRVFEISEVLFNCSAIGNIQHRQGGTTYYTFRYRNRHSSFNEDESIMLHRGLWKSLNLT